MPSRAPPIAAPAIDDGLLTEFGGDGAEAESPAKKKKQKKG